MSTTIPNDDGPITLTVTVTRHGHSTREKGAAITEGPPHVRAFHEGTTVAQLATALALNGYTFTVCTVFEDVSLLDWFGGLTLEPTPAPPA